MIDPKSNSFILIANQIQFNDLSKLFFWLLSFSKHVVGTKVSSLKLPGFNVLLVHLGYDNDELKAITIDHPDYGSTWRELDLKIIQDSKFKSLIEEKNIKLITWRQIKDVLY